MLLNFKIGYNAREITEPDTNLATYMRYSRQMRWLPSTEGEVVGLEWGPLSLVSTIEELLGRNSSGSGLESREYGLRDPSR
jgi:hypothetical protein